MSPDHTLHKSNSNAEHEENRLMNDCKMDDTNTKRGAVETIVYDSHWQAVSRSVVRKLDMTVMPMIWILFLFSYLDRNSIASAKLSTIEADLRLSGEHYNTVVSILNVGYMAMQIPNNMVLTRVRTPEKKAVATSMINVLAQFGNVMSPYFVRDQGEPRYIMAMILLVVFSACSGCTTLFLKWELRRDNRKITADAAGVEPRLFAT